MTADAPLVFALEGSAPLGAEVCGVLGVAPGRLEERAFEFGQHKARPLESVRRRGVFVLHSLHGDPHQSANDKLIRLLFFLATLRDAGAREVTAVIPHLCYARKDRRTKARDPVSTRYVAALFEAVGVDAVAVLDVHNPAAFQNAFRCRTECVEARRLLVDHVAAELTGEQEVAVISPDTGGAKRAEAFRSSLAEALGRDVAPAFVAKTRSEGVLSGGQVVGDVEGRVVIVVDDMICSGSTLVRAARACRDRGAVRVHAAATHGAFTEAASANLGDPALDSAVVLDALPPFALPEGTAHPKVRFLPAAPLLAESIRRMHRGESLVELFEG